MSTLAMRNSDYRSSHQQNEKLSTSTLSQRIRALEGAGITDTFIKKRIPSYAQASPVNQDYHSANSSKIYQNPSHFDSNHANYSMNSSVYSGENFANNRIYRSNSSDSIDTDNTFHENPDIVREDRIASPVNYHQIIDELNDAKSKLKKVAHPPTSPFLNSKKMGNVIVNTNLNQSANSLPSPTMNTSFSRATSKLLAESIRKANNSSTSMNQIPISIPLNSSANDSRSSTPGSVNSTHDLNHSKLGAESSSTRTLINVFNEPKNPDLTVQNNSYRSEYYSDTASYNKHTSPRPYVNPIGQISSLKNIAQEVFEHSNNIEDNISVRSAQSNAPSVIYDTRKSSIASNQFQQTFGQHRSSVDSDKQYVSQYTARNSNLLTKAPNLTSSSNDLLHATSFRAPSYENLDNNDFINSNNKSYNSSYGSKKTTSLYDEYLKNNSYSPNVNNSVNNRSNSVSSANTIVNNHINQNVPESVPENNSRSHLVSALRKSLKNKQNISK